MPESMQSQPEDAMSKPLATFGAAAAGAVAMYYLDPDLGAQRRAVLAKLVRTGLPLAHPAGGDPQSDAELRGHLQQRLGRMVSHPRAIRVDVENGVVRLSGRVLAKEREGLLAQVQQLAGVRKVVNAMTAHDLPSEIAGRGEPAPQPQHAG
jgi:hypothetical protein